LQETLSADYKISNIRLREGEHQYSLSKAIASFQLELNFPDVKEVIERLYGEERTNDVQFIRKVQTILKKMEKSDVVRILPKKNPWDLQRYALTSFKFQDVDKNSVIFATDEQIKQAQNMLHSMLSQRELSATKLYNIRNRIKMCLLGFIVVTSYAVSVWALVQATINPIVFVFAFSVAVICSIVLGKALS
jgi:hypothetical protein